MNATPVGNAAGELVVQTRGRAAVIGRSGRSAAAAGQVPTRLVNDDDPARPKMQQRPHSAAVALQAGDKDAVGRAAGEGGEGLICTLQEVVGCDKPVVDVVRVGGVKLPTHGVIPARKVFKRGEPSDALRKPERAPAGAELNEGVGRAQPRVEKVECLRSKRGNDPIPAPPSGAAQALCES